MKQMQEDMKLQSDPFNVEAQKEIERRITEARMNEKLEYAQEYLPESFIHTSMLYIEMEVNKVKFQAFVDSGAQSTIMSQAFVEKVGLMKDVDKRYHGTAVGVGTSKIIGRIHTCQLKIGNGHWIECSIQVLDNIDIDFLFGLDMMKKHRVAVLKLVPNRSP